MIMKFLKQLFGRRPKVDRNKTTENFQSFKKYQEAENESTGAWDSNENLLVKYIFQTKTSPFMGDDDLEEVRKVLKENGVTKKIL